jgi:hypothetical protein
VHVRIGCGTFTVLAVNHLRLLRMQRHLHHPSSDSALLIRPINTVIWVPHPFRVLYGMGGIP